MFGVANEVSYEGLTQTEEVMVDAVVQASLEDTPLANLVKQVQLMRLRALLPRFKVLHRH